MPSGTVTAVSSQSFGSMAGDPQRIEVEIRASWTPVVQVGADIAARMRTLRRLGDPYTDADIAGAAAAVDGKSELDVLVVYLQGLGIANEPQPAQTGAPASSPAEKSR